PQFLAALPRGPRHPLLRRSGSSSVLSSGWRSRLFYPCFGAHDGSLCSRSASPADGLRRSLNFLAGSGWCVVLYHHRLLAILLRLLAYSRSCSTAAVASRSV
ncbi:unnamed protein product, partial [Ectocarpus sp. 12 AP-2014]